MELTKISPKNKKGVVSGMIAGVIGLIFTIVIGFVLIATVLDADLLSATGPTGGTHNTSISGELKNTTASLSLNLSSGVAEIGNKIPIVLLIAIVVILFGALALLVLQGRKMGMFGGGNQF